MIHVMSDAVLFFKAMADTTRWRIVRLVLDRAMCVCELAEAISVTQPSVSRHMKLLEDADLVEHRRDGLWINYRLNEAPQNPYAKALLGHLQNWLEEDPDIQALIRKASTLDREVVCRRDG